MSSWLSKHFGVRLDSHTLGNLMKNAAPVAGTVMGGVPGLLLAGGLGAGGEAARGKTGIGDLLKSGLSNAALAGGGQAIAGHFAAPAATSALPTPMASPGAVPGLTAPPPFSLPSSLQTLGTGSTSGASPFAAGLSSGGGAGGGGIGGALRGLGGYVAKHPEPIGQAAAGLLGARQQDQKNQIAQQSQAFDERKYADEMRRRQQMSDMLQRLFAGGAIGPTSPAAAPPY